MAWCMKETAPSDEETMDKKLPQPFADEMRGIANASGMPLGK